MERRSRASCDPQERVEAGSLELVFEPTLELSVALAGKTSLLTSLIYPLETEGFLAAIATAAFAQTFVCDGTRSCHRVL